MFHNKLNFIHGPHHLDIHNTKNTIKGTKRKYLKNRRKQKRRMYLFVKLLMSGKDFRVAYQLRKIDIKLISTASSLLPINWDF